MYSAIERQQLLKIAKQSIQHGLTLGTRMELDVMDYQPSLREIRATFVTLKIDDLLRGCIGTITAKKPLALSVADNAFNAAFNDPRFGSLRKDEAALLQIEISVLSELEALESSSEQDVLQQLRPGQDGVLLSAGTHSATFLPAVWQQLPEPEDFLRHLKDKAGLDVDAWPNDMVVERYTTQTITSKKSELS